MRSLSRDERFAAPSGREMSSGDLLLIQDLYAIGAIARANKPITLNSEALSHVYVQARADLTEHPDILERVALKIVHAARRIEMDERIGEGGQKRRMCAIGIPTAGTPLGIAASLQSTVDPPHKFGFRQMREIRKDHGVSHGWTDIAPKDDVLYLTVENVMTTGTSIVKNLERLGEDGYPVKDMYHIVLVDREQGGVENLVKHGYKNVRVIYTLTDIAHALGYLQVWTPKEVADVERELAELRAQQST